MKIQLLKETPSGFEYLAGINVEHIPRVNESFEWDYNIYTVTRVVHCYSSNVLRIYGRMI